MIDGMEEQKRYLALEFMNSRVVESTVTLGAKITRCHARIFELVVYLFR